MLEEKVNWASLNRGLHWAGNPVQLQSKIKQNVSMHKEWDGG